ncbi:MAG TPA: substrate-binding domain-containing protein [Xanthobacteraceae bacterium]|nr:substrate-binding domain-containing protein [Xanthobacteraceae bacterium]
MAALPCGPVRAQQPGGDNLGLELVDPKVLRVCADPSNMPFSNESGEGFENKLAELLAGKLDKKLAYTWYPQSTGFVRQTLGSFRCDVIMGFPQGNDLVQSTNPYYRSVYTLVFKPGSAFEGVDTIGDARLAGKRIGIVAGTPPATYMVARGLMPTAKPYSLVVDTRVDSVGRAMTKDIASGDVDAGILWGPIAGYFARQADPPLRVVPLLKESGGPALSYRITMGVRPTDQNWKRELNGLIRDNQPAITKLMLGFNVPLLDENGRIISEPPAAKP